MNTKLRILVVTAIAVSVGYIKSLIGKLKPSMCIMHCAGEKLFVDYSGLTVPWVDKTSGEVQHA